MGSSPPRTQTKKSSGKTSASVGTRRARKRWTPVSPRRSKPEGIDAELLRIPGDVGIGVEVLDDRLVAQARDQLPKGLRACGGSLLLRHEHVAFDGGDLNGHASSSLYAPGGRGLGPRTTVARSFSTASSSRTR